MDLMVESFSQLSLKGRKFQIINPAAKQPAAKEDVGNFFKDVELDANLQPNDTMADLRKGLMLEGYIQHCSVKRKYLLHFS